MFTLFKRKAVFSIFVMPLFVLFSFAFYADYVLAAIIESGQPITGGVNNVVAGGGSVIPAVKFQLYQTAGTDALTKVGVVLRASSTMETLGQISGIGLYRESGAHIDFQINEDILINGAYARNPATSTLILLQPTGGYLISGAPKDFYIVASTSAAANLINGNAFDVQLQANYASTSASTGIGTAFENPPLKITFEQTVPVKISEVKAGSAGNDRDEFIELYNPNDFSIDVQNSGLAFHSFSAQGGATNSPITFYQSKKYIHGFGFFLIGSATNYSQTTPLDATYNNTGTNILVPNGGFSLATSTNIVNATSTSIDRVGWGTQKPENCENSDTTLANCAPTLAENDSSLERIAQGYPNATSTQPDMAGGGAHAFKGNGLDRNDNSEEFVGQSAPNPQNSDSPDELSFGGGFQDSGAPLVGGSWPSDSMTGAPIDISYVGFDFSEPLRSDTIVSAAATTTVTLVPQGTAPAQVAALNLCSSVSYNPSPSNYEPSTRCNLTAQLLANTTYVFEVGTSTAASAIRDFQGNKMDQDSFQAGSQSYRITFTTGGSAQTTKVLTPPQVIGSAPFSGSFNIPTNVKKLFISFSQLMDTSTLSASNIGLFTFPSGVKTATSLSGAAFSYNASTSVLTIDVSSITFSANTHYQLELDGQDSSNDTVGVKSAEGILLPVSDWIIPFDFGSLADSSAPKVLGVMPVQSGAANVPLNQIFFTAIFDDHIDVSTATSGAVTLGISGGAAIPASVSYDPASKELSLVTQNLLPANSNMVFTVKGGSVKNISGLYLGTDYTMTFGTENSNSDTVTAPSIAFVNADEFTMAVTFNEAVNSTDATKLSNYSLVYTPSGQTQQTLSLSALAGHSMSYDASKRTAKISDIFLPSGSVFTLTASGIRDISGNQMTSSSFGGTVLSYSASKGLIGPGSGGGGTGAPPPPSTFSTASGSGFLPPANIMVMNNFTSASTTYGFELPISKQIPINGKIVITFPVNSDYALCCAAITSTSLVLLNDINSDINGPGSGVIGLSAVSANNSTKTVTLTIDTATRNESGDTHDFLRFGITNIKNPSIAKGPDSSGYSLDIKTTNADESTIIESNFNLNPVFVGGGSFGGVATTTIKGKVLSGYDGTTGLNGANVFLHSPILGPMPRNISTSGSGDFSFTNLPTNNDYYIFTDPIVRPSATSTSYFGFNEPASMRATSTSILTQNLTLIATTSAQSLQINLSALVNTFTATEKIDVFAGGPGRFIVETVTPGAGAWTGEKLTVLSIPNVDGSWFVGIGPGMPKDGMMMGPPPSPNWVMPKPISLDMSGCAAGSCKLTELGISKSSHVFNVSAANLTISGLVKDASGNTLANTMVYAYSQSQRNGANGQSDTVGKFSMKVAQGSYNVGAFFPGMGQSQELSVEVDSSNNVYVNGSKTASTGQGGSNPLVITIKKPAYRITGKVTDGTNAVSNAPVFAYRTDGPGHADAMTDTSGNYTLYVDNGTWKVSTYISGYGRMDETTVVIAGADDTSGNDFAPSSATTYWSIAGTVFESSNATIDSGEGVSGVIVMARRGSSNYEAKTGSDGTYTMRVPNQSSGYSLEIFKPGYGRIPSVDANLDAITSFGVTGTTTKNIRINTRQVVTINVKDSSGNFVTVPKAYIDLFDISNNYGNHAEIINGTSTTVLIPNGASTTVRVFIPSVPPNTVSVASDNENSYVMNNSVLKVDGAETIKVLINTNLRTISGAIYHTSATSGNELKDAWIEVVDTSSGMHYGTSATSSAGVYNLKLADGTYAIVAVKPGYIMAPQSLTVSADASQNLIMTSASLTISGSITAGGSAAPYAFVRAEKVGGGFTATQADASGNYTLSVSSGTWRIFAASDRYSEAGYSGNPLLVSSSKSDINIALASQANIQSNLATSATFKDTAAGTFDDSTVNVRVEVDGGALGQSGSNSYITAKETVNYPNTSSVDVIADKAKDISAYSGDSQVNNLSSGKTATVALTYTVAELSSSGIDTPSEVEQLKVASVNEQNEWESLNTVATYKDSNGNAISVATTSASIPGTVASVTFTTTEATHFSAYALVAANDPSAPDAPSGVTATAAAANTKEVTVSWSASSGATGYFIYRDTDSGGSFPLLVNAGNVTSYINTGLTLGTTYYYKVAAHKSDGSIESAASGVVSAKPVVGDSGSGIAGGGGGLAPTIPSQTATPAIPTVSPAVPSSASKPSASALAVSPAFNRSLTIGSKGEDVMRLQKFLNSDPGTRISASGIGSPGNETEFFGSLTTRAVEKFQVKYGLAKAGDPGYGFVGPKTRAKLAEVFGEATAAAPAALPTTAPSSVGTPTESVGAATVSATFGRGLSMGTSGEDVKRLQQLLNSDPDTKIASTGAGSVGNESEYFGSLTAKAVQKFQVKYDLAKAGDPGYGLVGPKTRAKLSEIFEGTPVATPAALPTTAPSSVGTPTESVGAAVPAVPVVPAPVAPAPAVTPAPAPAPAPVPFWLQLTPIN